MAIENRHKSNTQKAWILFETHNIKPGSFCEKVEAWALNRLKKGFSHVTIIKKSEIEGVFTIITPYSSHLEIKDVYDPYFIFRLIESGRHVVETETRCAPIAFHGGITCVSIAKYILGITNWRIITPFQLYKFLMKGKENG